MHNMYRIIGITALIICMFTSACKKNNPNNLAKETIGLTVQEGENGYVLQWDKVNTSDFINYEIYRSDSPLPEPTPDEPLNINLRIASISDRDKNSFTDSLLFGISTNVYYKVIAKLAMRTLSSNSIKNTTNNIVLNGSFDYAYYNSDLDYIYFLSNNVVKIYDNTNNTLKLNGKTIDGGLATNLYYDDKLKFNTQTNGDKEVYLMNNNYSISSYDASTMTKKETFNFNLSNPNFTTFDVYQNHLYLLNDNTDSLLVYNTSTHQVESQIYLSSLSQYNSITISKDKSTMILAPGYNGSLYYSYNFNLNATGIPTLTHAENMQVNSASSGKIAVSNNGQFMTNDIFGAIFSSSFVNIGNLQSTFFNEQFTNYKFSTDNQYIFAQSFASTSSIKAFSLTDFSLIHSYFNTSSYYFLKGKNIIMVSNGSLGNQIIISNKQTNLP